MRTRIWAYKNASESANLLCDAITGCKIIRKRLSTYRHRPGDKIINWGSNNCPYPCINSNDAVDIARNKLRTFNRLMECGVPIPVFSTYKDSIPTWDRRVKKIVVRHLLESSEGAGIEIIDRGQPLPNAPLYVEYIPKDAEYRVHVMLGSPIVVQRKVLRSTADRASTNWQVRNTANGFVFQRDGINPPQCVIDAGISAVAAIGLDFGAVDVVYNNSRASAYVLEVNTAPGIEGTTVQDYARAL